MSKLKRLGNALLNVTISITQILNTIKAEVIKSKLSRLPISDLEELGFRETLIEILYL
jgi:hypothetical protein